MMAMSSATCRRPAPDRLLRRHGPPERTTASPAPHRVRLDLAPRRRPPIESAMRQPSGSRSGADCTAPTWVRLASLHLAERHQAHFYRRIEVSVDREFESHWLGRGDRDFGSWVTRSDDEAEQRVQRLSPWFAGADHLLLGHPNGRVSEWVSRSIWARSKKRY